MPSVNIKTYSEVLGVKVTKIFGEDGHVADITKSVSIFEKYTSKKSINAKCKQSTELVR